MMRCLLLIACLSLAVSRPPTQARADTSLPAALRDVSFDQRLNEQVPLDIPLVDEAGRPVTLGNYFGDRPVILVLAYYRCPMLCSMVLNGLVRGLLDVPFEPDRDFQIVTVSFDARETPRQAQEKKKTYVDRYGRKGAAAGWHFLTGPQASIDRLTESVGFRYKYDPQRDEFAHASGIMVLTPQGRISHYFYDVQYSGRDLRLALVEASQGKIGSPVDQVLLYCFHYDPNQGKYGPTIMTLVRAGGVLTLIGMGVLIVWARRRTRPEPLGGAALEDAAEDSVQSEWNPGLASDDHHSSGSEERRP
jgi:protein SCO1/2